MDFIKKNLWLFMGGGLTTVLLLAALVFLFWQVRAFRRVNATLAEEQKRLEQFQHRSPFPSEANVQLVKSNLTLLERYQQQLADQLRQGQIEERKRQPVDFNYDLQASISKMFAEAKQQMMELPPKFAFGFESYYLEGRLPAMTDVARLTVQFQMIEALFHQLCQSRISEIVAIERQLFEQHTPGTAEPAPAGGQTRVGAKEDSAAQSELKARLAVEPPEARGLYTREHFTLTLKARDEIILALLNALASSGTATTDKAKIFAVVSKLTMSTAVSGDKKTTDGAARRLEPQPPDQDATPPGLARGSGEDTRPHEERIVAGREMMQVQMELDLYRLTGKPQENVAP